MITFTHIIKKKKNKIRHKKKYKLSFRGPTIMPGNPEFIKVSQYRSG